MSIFIRTVLRWLGPVLVAVAGVAAIVLVIAALHYGGVDQRERVCGRLVAEINDPDLPPARAAHVGERWGAYSCDDPLLDLEETP